MSVDRIMRVPYQVPGGQYWQWVNIYTRLSQERILFLNQPLTTSVANSIVSALLYLESDERDKPINLYINSYGDPAAMGVTDDVAGVMSISAALAIYDTIQYIKSEVTTICMGQAVGMAALLLSAGAKGKRVCLPHASIALNQPRSGARGQATDIQINVEAMLEKKNTVLEILAKNTGQPIEKIAKDTDRTFYLTPHEAKDYGLVDRVLVSPKELKVES